MAKKNSFWLAALVVLTPAVALAQATPTPTPTATPTITPIVLDQQQSLSFEWDAVTTRQDGSAFDPATELHLYEFRKDGAVKGNVSSPGVGTPPATSYEFTDALAPGVHNFTVRARDKFGAVSGDSNPVAVQVVPTPTHTPTATNTPLAPPARPSNFGLQAAPQ